jgi:hypothetical protein
LIAFPGVYILYKAVSLAQAARTTPLAAQTRRALTTPPTSVRAPRGRARGVRPGRGSGEAGRPGTVDANVP